LIEHTAGKWPFWLSPRQVLLVTVAERHAPFAARAAA
jgi:threonyl-tRNA synthetase